MPLLAATAYPPGLGPWSLNVSVETLVVAEMLSLGVAYWAALRLLGPRYVEPGERPATRAQVAFFAAALVSLGVSEGWPLAGIANNYLFSAHMLQHLIFVLVVPPLLLLGTPHWLARALLKRSVVWPVMKKLTRPIPATIIFNVVVVASHAPQVINLTVHNQGVHIADHLLLLGAGLIMWFPVLSPLPELPRLSYPAQMLYLFLQTILPTIPASFLTFASKPLYHYYAGVPRAFGLSALADTQISGLLMKVGMGLELWTIIAVIFFRWSSQEERSARPPNELEWQAVERELNRTESQSN
ncbi:MAG TPA: cytochrome c oxidase assembly protein [Actinomycetota bacterium]|nr:cytochrome c oxidase assembly protein [Actinomycetota bacterium]